MKAASVCAMLLLATAAFAVADQGGYKKNFVVYSRPRGEETSQALPVFSFYDDIVDGKNKTVGESVGACTKLPGSAGAAFCNIVHKFKKGSLSLVVPEVQFTGKRMEGFVTGGTGIYFGATGQVTVEIVTTPAPIKATYKLK